MSVSGVVTINQGGPHELTLGDGSSIPISQTQNFNTNTGISTFNVLNVLNELSVGAGVTVASTGFFGSEVGIGTTNNVGFLTGPVALAAHVEGSTWSKNGLYTAGKLAITTKADGSLQTDDRVIPSGDGTLGPGDTTDYGPLVPFVDYGSFQVETGGAAFIVNNVLMVPSVGQATVGFGTTNGALIPESFVGNGNRYLTKVGINTYYARSIFDVGAASTTMNSYFIPPSLTQSEINLMQSLWQTPGATGHNESKKVTPDGIVPGAIVYNKTTDTIQVGASTNTFRNLSPVVAFGTIVSGSTVSTDGHNLNTPSNNSNDADFTFSTALQSANYTVIVSCPGTTTFTVPEAQKAASGFRVTFSSAASGQDYSVMVLQL